VGYLPTAARSSPKTSAWRARTGSLGGPW